VTRRRWFLKHEAENATLEVERVAPDRFRVRLAGRAEVVEVSALGSAGAATVTADGRVFTFFREGSALVAHPRRERLELGTRPCERAGAGAGRAEAESVVRAPMPGRVLKVLVAEGDGVEPGAPLVIVEAMKMENELLAARAGVVKRLRVQVGDAVDRDAPLLEIE
jgi:acetyl-CoA/propionyl-CoA carboxylase biotin carboxyl carrier protein